MIDVSERPVCRERIGSFFKTKVGKSQTLDGRLSDVILTKRCINNVHKGLNHNVLSTLRPYVQFAVRIFFYQFVKPTFSRVQQSLFLDLQRGSHEP